MIFVLYQLLVVFIFGALVGSFCNVAIARMPYEKSLLWPGSSCGSCYQPVRWYHNLPLISYLWLGGKCNSCGAAYSGRYFWIELAAGLGFVGLFLLAVVRTFTSMHMVRAPRCARVTSIPGCGG